MTDNQIHKLVERLKQLNNEYSLLAFDEEWPQELGAPCSESQIAEATKHLGCPLPPTYRSFLSQHNGWTDVNGSAKFLSVEDFGSEWVTKRIQDIRYSLMEFGGVEMLDSAFMIMLAPDQSDFVYLDASKPQEGGEFEVVHYDLRNPDMTERYPSFGALLEEFIALTERSIDSQK